MQVVVLIHAKQCVFMFRRTTKIRKGKTYFLNDSAGSMTGVCVYMCVCVCMCLCIYMCVYIYILCVGVGGR